MEPLKNKEWRGARSIEEGLRDRHRRQGANYKGYRDECVQKRARGPTAAEGLALSTLDVQSKGFQLAWSASTPRLVVLTRSPTAPCSLASLYQFMSQMRTTAERELRRLDRQFDNFGCHLCLYVSAHSGTNVTRRSDRILTADPTMNQTENAVGYIQLDECQYSRWLPLNLRDTWFNEFSTAEHYVST